MTKKIRLNWRSAVLGMGVGALSMVVLAAAVAGVMARGLLDVATMEYWAAAILAVAGLLGGLTAMLGGGSPADAALGALGEMVVLWGLNWVLNEGKMEGFPLSLLVLAGGCGAAVLLRMGRRDRRRKRPRRKKS